MARGGLTLFLNTAKSGEEGRRAGERALINFDKFFWPRDILGSKIFFECSNSVKIANIIFPASVKW